MSTAEQRGAPVTTRGGIRAELRDLSEITGVRARSLVAPVAAATPGAIYQAGPGLSLYADRVARDVEVTTRGLEDAFLELTA